METPVILMHGFSNEQALAIMRAARKAVAEAGADAAAIAFATTTPTNVGWKVSELLSEVSEEHAYMKKKTGMA